MTDHHDELNAAIEEVDRALKVAGRIRVVQVRNSEQRDFFKSTAFSWFRSRRPIVLRGVSVSEIQAIDQSFQIVLDATGRAATKATYVSALRNAKDELSRVRTSALLAPAAPTTDAPPDFSPLAVDPGMQSILSRRWGECRACIVANAPLAATVMMGGLLEALFVARANKLSNKAVLFSCPSAPIDGKTGKPLDLRQWTLSPYIDVGHELGWITPTGKSIAGVLREYRNYVHPEKERSHGVRIEVTDAEMFWEMTKGLCRQLLALQGAV